MNNLTRIIAVVGCAAGLLTGCNEQPEQSNSTTTTTTADNHDDHDHTAGDGHDHADHENHDGHDSHDHGEEVTLGTTMIGDMQIECTQGHGEAEPGKELHLVVKLPYTDSGATVVRAWIGTEDRLASIVGKAEFAASNNNYDVHCEAPSPLPENAKWWIEIEKPDGSKELGSIRLR